MGGSPSNPTGGTPDQIAQVVSAAQSGVTQQQEQSALQPAQRVRFALDRVQPPSNLYFGPDDFLEVEAQTELTTETLQILARFMLVTGEIKQNSYTMPIGGGAPNPAKFALGEGFLLSVIIFPSLVGTQRGQLYVTTFISHGPLVSAGVLDGLLIQGYVDAVTALAWPGGYMEPSLSQQGAIISKTLSNPAAGANFTFTVPLGQRWQPQLLTFKLVTSAAAATRDANLIFTDGTHTLATLSPTLKQTAGLTKTFSFLRLLGSEIDNGVGDLGSISLPDIYLEPGWTMQSAIENIDVGDQLSLIAASFQVWQSA